MSVMRWWLTLTSQCTMRHVVEQKLGRVRQWSVDWSLTSNWDAHVGAQQGWVCDSRRCIDRRGRNKGRLSFRLGSLRRVHVVESNASRTKNRYQKNQKSLLQKDKITFYHRPIIRYGVEITELAKDGMPMSRFLVDHLMLECLIHNNNEK